jgi:hypothetical protein
MATHRIRAKIVGADTGVPLDYVGNQITAVAAPSVTNQPCWVLADGGSDEGVSVRFEVPQNYVGTPVLVIKGILDGAPSNGDDLGFGFRKRAVADNEAADGTYDAEQTFQSTDIGSTGSNHANEDVFVASITLTGADYAAGDTVFGNAYIDASGTTYTGNFLLTEVLFQYADA